MIVSLIGAGSFDFTAPTLRSLMSVAKRRGLQIHLCDRAPDALDAMTSICRRLADEQGARISIEGHLDLGPAVQEADFVIITLNHGGLDADIADFHNALDHGFLPKHVDTIGPAGWLRALRMGAFMQGLLPLLPDGATVLDLSNPLSLIVRMAHRRGFRAIGFCHGAMNRRASFKAWLSLDENPEIEVWGTNHLAYLTKLRLGGRDRYPDLIAFLRSSTDHLNWRYNLELFDRYGIMPVLEMQHTADFFPGFNDEQSLHDYGLHLWEYESRRVNAGNRRERMDAFASGQRPISELHPSSEGVAEVIDALLGGAPHRGILNAALSEETNGMPVGAIVEGWMTVDAAGVHFDPAPVLPTEVQQHLHRIQHQQDLAAQAFEEGNMEKLMEAYRREPNMTDEETTRSLLRRALREHEALLPGEWSI